MRPSASCSPVDVQEVVGAWPSYELGQQQVLCDAACESVSRGGGEEGLNAALARELETFEE